MLLLHAHCDVRVCLVDRTSTGNELIQRSTGDFIIPYLRHEYEVNFGGAGQCGVIHDQDRI